MAYRGLTAIGANYLATRLAQELPVEFTKVQIGAGTPVGNPSDVTNLQNYKLDAKILKKSQENNTVEITIQVVNNNIDQGFYLKEIGVFVNDDTEKLYWYCNEDNAQYIPAKTDSAIAFEIDIKMEVTNVESPILNWSGQGTWIDKKYLESELIKKIDKGGYSGNAKNLDDDIKKRLIQGTIPNSLNSAEKIVAALQGNGGLKFDENLLYIEDKGIKKKGFYYLSRLMSGIFECLEQTEETVNNSAKFKDISNKSNSDRLDNLSINYNNKLDKGLYEGDAKSLKDEIDSKVSKSGDKLEEYFSWYDNKLKIGTPNNYGRPVIMLDKSGNYSLGIGANGTKPMTIRYGSANIGTGQWVNVDNNFIHEFDGIIKILGNKRVLNESDRITLGNNSSNNIYYNGDTNAITQAGFYYLNNDATNRPFNKSGSLINAPWVHNKLDSQLQLFIPDSADYIAIRNTGPSSGPVLNNWKKIYTESSQFIYSFSSNTNYTYNKGNPVQRLTLDTYKCLVAGTYQILATYETQEARAQIKVEEYIVYDMDGDLHETNTLQTVARLNTNDVVTFTQRYSDETNISFIRIGD